MLATKKRYAAVIYFLALLAGVCATARSASAAETAARGNQTRPSIQLVAAKKKMSSQQRSSTTGGGYGRGGTGGLPYGSRYYNGRYFGSLNDRFYGPQYGYF